MGDQRVRPPAPAPPPAHPAVRPPPQNARRALAHRHHVHMVVAVLLVLVVVAVALWQVAARQGAPMALVPTEIEATVVAADADEPAAVPAAAPHCDTVAGTRAVVAADGPGAHVVIRNDGRVTAVVSSGRDDVEVEFAGEGAPAVRSAEINPGQSVTAWVRPPAPAEGSAVGQHVDRLALNVSALGIDTVQHLRLRPVVVAGDPGTLCAAEEEA